MFFQYCQRMQLWKFHGCCTYVEFKDQMMSNRRVCDHQSFFEELCINKVYESIVNDINDSSYLLIRLIGKIVYNWSQATFILTNFSAPSMRLMQISWSLVINNPPFSAFPWLPVSFNMFVSQTLNGDASTRSCNKYVFMRIPGFPPEDSLLLLSFSMYTQTKPFLFVHQANFHNRLSLY